MCARSLIINADIVSNGAVRKGCGLYLNEDGRIADVFGMDDYDRSKFHGFPEVIDVKGKMVCPGFIDTHTHGIGGFSTEDNSVDSILGMSDCLAKHGVTGFLPTLYAGSADKMVRETKTIVQAMGKEKGARILGIHLEGPFLNPVKGGAQDASILTNPDEHTFIRFIEAGEGNVVAMTIAPELKGSDKIAAIAKENNITLLMGHTNATYDQAKAAMEMGILHATHLFNGMSAMDHKNPGVAGAALLNGCMSCEIIPDGVHVHRDLVMHVARTKADDKVVLITDSLGPTSLGKGTYDINGGKAILGDRGAFVDAKDPSKLCGSALTLDKGVSNLIGWGADPAHAIRLATQNPAHLYGFTGLGAITKGNMADLVVLDKDYSPSMVFIGGRQVYRKQEGRK